MHPPTFSDFDGQGLDDNIFTTRQYDPIYGNFIYVENSKDKEDWPSILSVVEPATDLQRMQYILKKQKLSYHNPEKLDWIQSNELHVLRVEIMERMCIPQQMKYKANIIDKKTKRWLPKDYSDALISNHNLSFETKKKIQEWWAGDLKYYQVN